MKTLVLVLGIATLPPLASAFAQEADTPAEATDPSATDAAKIFARLDADANGRIEAAEITEDRKAFFERLVRTADADGDGAMTLAELEKGLVAADVAGDADPAEPAADREFDTREFFARLDANADGKLALDELDENLRTRLKPLFDRIGEGTTEITEQQLADIRAKAAAGQAANERKAFFARLDVNGDGRIEKDEVPERAQQLVQALLDRQSAKEGATVTSLTREQYLALAEQDADAADTAAAPTEVGPGLIRALDADGDGKLSKAELAAAATKFDQLDADMDGHLDTRELLGSAATTEAPAGGETSDAEFAKRIFDTYDTNGDGQIALAELSDPAAARLRDNFDRVDASIKQDGVITLEEFRKTVAEVRAKSN